MEKHYWTWIIVALTKQTENWKKYIKKFSTKVIFPIVLLIVVMISFVFFFLVWFSSNFYFAAMVKFQFLKLNSIFRFLQKCFYKLMFWYLELIFFHLLQKILVAIRPFHCQTLKKNKLQIILLISFMLNVKRLLTKTCIEYTFQSLFFNICLLAGAINTR